MALSKNEKRDRELFEKFMPQWHCFGCKTPPGPEENYYRYLCMENNHSLCFSCKMDNGSCSCKSMISSKPSPFLTKMREVFPWYYCRYYENGCREILKEAEYEDHKISCIYRKVYCLDLKCKEKIIFKNVYDHMFHPRHPYLEDYTKFGKYEIDSSIEGMRAKRFQILNGICYPCQTWPYYYWEGQMAPTFYLHRFKNGPWYMFWIQMYGSPAEAKDYEYTICLSKKGKEHLFYDGKVQPIDSHFTEIFDDQKALLVKENVYEKYIEVEQEKIHDHMMTFKWYTIHYKIRCLKEEAKDGIVRTANIIPDYIFECNFGNKMSLRS